MSILSTGEARSQTEITVLGLTPQVGITRERYNHFAKIVPERFEGGATVKLLVDGQAGTEEAMAAGLRRGRGQFGMMTIPGVSVAVPEMAVLMAPYLFDSYAEEDFVLDKFLTPLMHDLFAARGLVFIGFSDSGFFNVFARAPLHAPGEAVNRRLRAAGGEASRLFLKAAGADVVEMPFADLIPALQTGLVDGTVTTNVMFEAANLIREVRHVTLTRHMVNPGVLMANKAWFDTLSPANQELIRTAMFPMQDIRDGVRGDGEKALKTLIPAGLIVHEPTTEQRAAWKRAGLSTHKDLIARLGGESQKLYDAMLAGKEAYAEAVAGREPTASR
ncbi:MAG: TRAP transporter substrate-binding protein [Rhodospirillaceae bacterium]|nr:TRAP transporter substrate-binding protein [Rhodospirillaceae bacterium]